MQKLTSTLLLFLLLLTSVMSHAADKTFVLKTTGTIDTDKAYLIVYQNGTSATTGTLMSSSFTSSATSAGQCAPVGSTVQISSNQIETASTNAFTFLSTGTDGSYYIKNNAGYYFGNYSSGSSTTGKWFAATNTSSPGTNYYNTVSFSNSAVIITGSYNSWTLGYSTDVGGTSGNYGFHYNGNSSVYLYEEVTGNSITCTTSAHGTVTPSATSAIEGASVTLTPTPATGYQLKELTVTGQSEVETTPSADGTYTFTMPASAVTVTATFAPIAYTITYTLNGGTNATTNPATYTIEDQITLSDPTRTDYTFIGWTDDNGTKVTTISQGTTGNITLTASWKVKPQYTRTAVTPGTWQSFCLPFNIDIDNLQTTFDKIHIPYDGEELVIYDDLDDATTLTKRRVVRKATASGTGDEENSTRYSFAYSPAESNAYDFYLADFTKTEKVVIPQGMPFFAHLKADDTQTSTTITLAGYLWDDEEALTGIQTNTFPVYSDKTLQTLDTSKTFTSIGYLSADTDFNATGAIYTMTDGGTMSTINPDDMTPNHAYLMATSATAIILNPIDVDKLDDITTITDYDLNGDGLETIADAAYLISILGGADDTTGKADLNQDGTINMTDLNLLINHILQK